MKEHGNIYSLHSSLDIVRRDDDADWQIEIQGFLGIVDILGVQHLMVLIEKQEIATIPHRHYPEPNTIASIYELQEIELIPFEDVTLRSPAQIPSGLHPQSYEF